MPQVVGTVQLFEKRPNNGPYAATIETPDGRTILLKTFDAQLAREIGLEREKGHAVAFEYRDEQGRKLNPNTQQPYVDHVITAVGGAGNGASADPGIPGLDAPTPAPTTFAGADAQPQQQRQNFGDREDPQRAWRIALGVGAHLAVETLPLLEDRTFESQTQLAMAWALWVFTTSVPNQQQAGQPSTAPGAYADDDIPF